MLAYFAADLPARNGRTSPYRRGSQAARGISTTRGSLEEFRQVAAHRRGGGRFGRAQVAVQDAGLLFVGGHAVFSRPMLDPQKIRAITIDLDDTLWPIWPTIRTRRKRLACIDWLVDSTRP